MFGPGKIIKLVVLSAFSEELFLQLHCLCSVASVKSFCYTPGAQWF